MPEKKGQYATVSCPYCLTTHKFPANFHEWRIKWCRKCNRVFNIEPLRETEPFTYDKRMDEIYRLSEEDINQLMVVAFDLGDIMLDYVKELAERKKHLRNGWYIGDTERGDDKDYYGE